MNLEYSNHRQQEIISALRKSGGSLRINALARDLNVTKETIRRNLKHLAESGIIDKVHGGAKLIEQEDEGDFKHRLSIRPAAKQQIAKTVAKLIKNDSSLFLDVGSTTSYIADALRDHENLLVVTNSVSVAYKLATRNGNRVFMAGGELRAHDGGAFSSQARDFANNFKNDFAILSSAAINPDNGYMLFDLDEAEFSRAILKNSKTSIMAADSEKFKRSAPIALCDPSIIDIMVTEREPDAALSQAFENWGTDVQIASQNGKS